jgi:hypothetical protein
MNTKNLRCGKICIEWDNMRHVIQITMVSLMDGNITGITWGGGEYCSDCVDTTVKTRIDASYSDVEIFWLCMGAVSLSTSYIYPSCNKETFIFINVLLTMSIRACISKVSIASTLDYRSNILTL